METPFSLINRQIFYDSRTISRFEGGEEIEEFRINRYGGGISAGRVLRRWGEFRIGLRRYTGDAEVRIGDPGVPDIDIDGAEAFLRLSYDTLDNRNWPRAGRRCTSGSGSSRWRGLARTATSRSCCLRAALLIPGTGTR
ncbi:MAG: hypothetical protein ACREVY_14455 [Gammaproteobacteria bacterium]